MEYHINTQNTHSLCDKLFYNQDLFFLHGSCTTDNKKVKYMRLEINLKSWLKNGVQNVAIVFINEILVEHADYLQLIKISVKKRVKTTVEISQKSQTFQT